MTPNRPHWRCLAIFLMAAITGGLFAQEQPLVTDETPETLPVTRPDPLREVALPKELHELAENPLPATGWRERLIPVYSSIEGIPVNTVEQAAFKYRRARIRLTNKDRATSKEPFRLMQDRKEHPELYWGKPVALHGYLTEIKNLPMAKNGEAWFEGRLKIWNEDRTVRFVAARLPEGIKHGENLHQPATVIGYVFALEAANSEQPEPLIVASWVRRHQAALDPSVLPASEGLIRGFTANEWDAYYRLLLHARLIDQGKQERLAKQVWEKRLAQLEKPRPLFVDLFKSLDTDPEIYRGKPVTLSGTLRKLTPWQEMQEDRLNDYGIEKAYEGWIFTEDSQSNPTIVVFSENPDNLPTGDDLSLPVKVTGYVFKMYAYGSRDQKLRRAPMLIAGKMEKMSVADPAKFPVAWVGAAIGLLVAGIVLFLWSSHQKDKQFRQTRENDEKEEPPKFDNLEAD